MSKPINNTLNEINENDTYHHNTTANATDKNLISNEFESDGDFTDIPSRRRRLQSRIRNNPCGDDELHICSEIVDNEASKIDDNQQTTLSIEPPSLLHVTENRDITGNHTPKVTDVETWSGDVTTRAITLTNTNSNTHIPYNNMNEYYMLDAIRMSQIENYIAIRKTKWDIREHFKLSPQEILKTDDNQKKL